MTPAYLLSACFGPGVADYCRDAHCVEAVKENPATGRWYITMGHAGFNTRANNGSGYATRAAALAVHRRYHGRGR